MKSLKNLLAAKWLLLAIISLFSFISCQKNGPDFPPRPGGLSDNADVAIDWYKLQLKFLLERNSTLNGAYFGYIGIGLYEAVQPGIGNSVSLSNRLYQMPEMPATEKSKDYNWVISANAALASMIRSYNTGLTPANLVSIDSLETAYNDKLRNRIRTDVFDRSQAFGKSIASAIVAWSLTDNFNPSNVGYVPPVFPGSWVPTPPAFANGINPYVGAARPFLASNLTIVAPAPLAYSESVESEFYKMVKNVYDVSKALTQEQKNTALFWVDQGNGTGVTPHGHDFSIVTQVLMAKHANLALAAEAYAKTGIAEREGTIVCFRSKYTYNLVRPVTYIRKFIDTSWLPFIVTPPHPEYPAAHAYVTGSVMQALAQVLGDHVSITDHTYDFRGWTPRSYATIFKVAEEAGISRLYGGIHYLPSINTGLSLARDMGDRVGDIELTQQHPK